MPTTAPDWSPPAGPGPLPADVLELAGPALDALALERCRARGDTQRSGFGKEVLACKRCAQEVLVGRELSPLVDLDDYLLQVPLPPRATPLHRKLLALLADGGERDLATLMELTGTSETNCSARLRDLRQWGYPIARRMTGGRPLYRLAA